MKIKTFDDLDNALLELGKAKAELQTQEAAMNEEIQAITDKYAGKTAECSGTVATIEDAIEAFCEKNKDAFDESRSKIFNHGKVGFRTNPPSVKQLNKKWKVESSIAFAKKLFGLEYLREKTELDKAAILGAYAAGKLKDEDLAGMGLRIEQEETFTAEANWVELKNVKAA